MKYSVSEGETPWDRWYGEGKSQFIKTPAQAELIVTYYGIVYGIDILDTQTVEDYDSGYPCSEFYIVKVKESDSSQMKNLGWTDFENS